MCNQIAATIVSVVDDVAQGIKRKSLADNGGRLQRYLVVLIESIHPCENNALNRTWNLFITDLFGTTQKLLKEKRIALGACDAVLCELTACIYVTLRQFERFRFSRRP